MDERDAAISRLQSEIDRADARLRELREAGHSRAANCEFQTAIMQRQEQAREILDRIRTASADAWPSLRSTVERAYDDLHVVVER